MSRYLTFVTAAALTIVTNGAFAQSEAQVVVSTVVASGFAQPVEVTHASDGSGRLFVVEQSGLIRIVTEGAVLPMPFLDLRGALSTGGERGALGLAFHPNYSENGFFYVNYTDRSGTTRIARFTVSAADPNRAVRESEEVLLEVRQPFGNHNGGGLEFGPLDGFLYIALGDGGSGNDPQNHGQNANTLLGTILRIDVDNGFPFAIPADNPFVGRDGADEIWAWGLRNPWRFSFDRVTGDLYIGDVGQSAWEEIDFQAAGTAGGLNFGWRPREGPCPRGRQQPCDAVEPGSGLIDPIAFYGRSVGQSVTGGFVYRGTRFPALAGRYFYGDFLSGRIWSLPPAGPGGLREPRQELDTELGISSFGEDEAGELYVVDYFAGTVRLVEDAVNAPAIVSATLPRGVVGVPYFMGIPVGGGVRPYRYERVSGSLAPGLTGPDPDSGLVTGTPVSVGTFGPFTVRVTDARGLVAERALTHVIGMAVSDTPAASRANE